ncbi:phage tail tape measure protein [Sphingobium fuliginis]|jgi:hypothetical protein|uniref:phage tail tape measure protein n=1 Tax=Sphingobium fuliginis (strain ATCC 27551) TaxID=336203 RepID=UPI0037C95A5B
MATGGALIGALRVTLGLDSANFEAGTKKARASAERDMKAIQKAIDGLKGRFDAVVAGFGANELYEAGKRALDYASSLGEVAQQMGVTTKELQQYRYAASQVGLSNDEMDKALARLTKTMGEAKAGSKAQASVFRELGVSIEDANGRVYSAGEVIPKLADALSKIKDPATRARLEIDLFGKTGQKLDTMLAGGSAAVNELRDAAQQLGLVLSDEQIQKADDTADKLAALKQILETRLASTVADNADAILTLANALGTLASKSLDAFQNFQNFRNLRGLTYGASPEGAKGLLSTASGRQVLARDIQNRLDRNMQARASGQGDPDALDAEFKNLIRARNGVIRAGRAADRIAAAQNRPTVAVGDGALPTVASTPTKPKKRTGPTPEEVADKHEQDMSRLRQEQLQAQLSLTNDAEDRADLQSQLLLEEYNERKAQVENDEHFTVDQKRAQVAALKALYGVSGEGDDLVVGGARNSLSAGISREMQERLAREAFDMQSAEIEIRRGDLQGQLNLARTAEERRRIELEILDLEYKLREAKLDQVINSQESSQAEKDLAAMQKGKLGQQRAIDTANINQQNMGPMASYLDSLPQTAAEVNESFEKVAADGLANMNDQLANAAANTLKLKGLAGQLFNQLIADLIKLQIQQAAGGSGGIIGGLLNAATSVFGGGNSLAGSIGAANANVARLADSVGTWRLPGLATGGTISGFGGVDNNLLSINGVGAAKVSASERIRVEKAGANDNDGRPIMFDLRGAVLTADLLAQMNAMADGAAVRGAMGGSALAQDGIAQRGRRRIPGR